MCSTLRVSIIICAIIFLASCGQVQQASMKEEGWDYACIIRCVNQDTDDLVVDQYMTRTNDYPGVAQRFQLVARRRVARDIELAGIKGNKPSSRTDELIIDGLIARQDSEHSVTFSPTQAASLRGDYSIQINTDLGKGVVKMHDPLSDEWFGYELVSCR